MINEVREKLEVSERRACRVLGQPRSTQRRQPYVPDDEPRLVAHMIDLATEYGRYGYRRITALLRQDGWKVNHKRVERLWRREGLKVPSRQPKRGRLWLNDGSCIRLRPTFKDHVWAYDFVHARTHEGRADADRVHKLITEDIPARVAADTAYKNAQKNSDKQNARIEHDKALARMMTAELKDDTELFKQFMDNPGFNRWMKDTVFGLTYPAGERRAG